MWWRWRKYQIDNEWGISNAIYCREVKKTIHVDSLSLKWDGEQANRERESGQCERTSVAVCDIGWELVTTNGLKNLIFLLWKKARIRRRKKKFTVWSEHMTHCGIGQRYLFTYHAETHIIFHHNVVNIYPLIIFRFFPSSYLIILLLLYIVMCANGMHISWRSEWMTYLPHRNQ